jgi:hypothetical protein
MIKNNKIYYNNSKNRMDRRRLILSFVLNILMIILAISTIIIEIVNIHNNPDSVYQNVWGLFRYFTIDGNILSLIFTIIISVNQYKALRIPKEQSIKDIIVSQFLYTISLMSACTDFVIFVVVVLIFIPMADSTWRKALVGSYNSSSFHVTIPILLNLRFIFLDIRERDYKFYEKFIGGVPMCIYGVLMFILCSAKVFKSFDKNVEGGDGKIPYPFLDVYHQHWLFCLGIAVFIFVFGFGIGFLLDFLNKKCEKLVWPYEFNRDSDIENNFNKENEIEPNSNE